MGIGDLLPSKRGKIGILGGLVAAFFLPPKSISVFFLFLVILLVAAGLYLKTIWVEAQPNEWMIIVRNSKQVKAGIGLKTFVYPNEMYVKFPSAVERVEFFAKNVTKQMQGVQVDGVAFWTVYRYEDGPFRCYRYMQGGGDANSSVRTMCESIVRNQMANCSLEEVLRQRNKLKEKLKKELQTQLTDWGIWLESVDLKDVRISSNTLFEDLQAPFRLETNLKAEHIRLKTSEKMREKTLSSEYNLNQARQENSTEVQKIRIQENFNRASNTAQYKEKLTEFEKRKITAEKELALATNQINQTIEELKAKNEKQLKQIAASFENANLIKSIELDKEHNETSLRKYTIDAVERIYKRQSVREIKVTQFVGDNKNLAAAMMPGFQYAIAQSRTAD